jgi:hypothetical protein
LNSANNPNTTSVTMATTVMSGFRIAKSEMNMGGDPAEVYFWFSFRAGSTVPCGIWFSIALTSANDEG